MALTTDFVTAVRRQGSIPSTFTSADILAIGDEEIQTRFVPLLESLRQNYFIREVTSTPDARGRIALPLRSVGATLRSVQLWNGNGWRSLPLRDLGDADYISAGALPDAYALDGGSIMLLPNGTTGTLRIRYPARPGRMALDTDANFAARIDSVTPGSTTTTLTTAPAFLGGTIIDIISAGPAHQHKAIQITQAALVVQNADLTEMPIIGDYVAVYDRSPFVPLPEELYGALVHSTAANILLQLAYLEESSAQEKRAQRIIDEARTYLKPRNEGNPQVVKGGLRRALSGLSRRGRW